METQTTRNADMMRGIYDPIIASTNDEEKQRRFALANLIDNVKRQIEAIQWVLLVEKTGQQVPDETIGKYINLFISISRIVEDFEQYCPMMERDDCE